MDALLPSPPAPVDRRRAGPAPSARVRTVVRVLAVAGLVGILVLGTSGALGAHIFHQYSLLKYVLIVAGAVFGLLVVGGVKPGGLALAMVIVAAPVAPFVMKIKGEPVSALLATAIAAAVIILVDGTDSLRVRSGALARVTPWICVLLALPAVVGHDVSKTVMSFLAVIGISWMIWRVSTLYPSARDVIVLVFIVVAGLQGGLAVVQHVTGHATNLYGGGVQTYSQSYFFDYGSAARTTGTFYDPISLGNVLAIALPFGALTLLRREVPAYHRFAAGLASILVLAGLVVALSRESWIAAALGCVLVAATSSGDQRRRGLALVAVLAVASAVAATSVYGNAVVSRFDTIFHPTSSSARTAAGDKMRIQLWKASFQVFRHHPWTGVGLSRLTFRLQQLVPGSGQQGNAQNLFLQYLGEGGILGGAAIALFYGALIRDLQAAWRRDPLAPALIGSLAALTVTWLTDVTFNYTAVAACVAVLVGLIASGRVEAMRQAAVPETVLA
jgi:O-antigen ligase